MALTFDGSTNTISGLLINSANITDGSIVNADINASAAIASTKLSGITSGITESDQWRVTSNFDSSNTHITSNWSRHTAHGAGLVGSGMSESSGIFTFPSTGIYRIDFHTIAYRISASNVRFINQYIKTTTDNSSYGEAAVATGSISNDAEAFSSGYCTFTFDVTDVSTHKVKFFVQAEQQLRWYADPNNGITAIFTKLGDT
tara:strand:+ start:111 stop:716 length:606 start_codon:yes stop_codon:yes gene_type:complete